MRQKRGRLALALAMLEKMPPADRKRVRDLARQHEKLPRRHSRLSSELFSQINKFQHDQHRILLTALRKIKHTPDWRRYQEWLKALRAANKPKARPCVVCGRNFKARAGARTCSPKCRVALHRSSRALTPS